MSADSFHHVIEQGKRKKQHIEDFQNFADLVDFGGKTLLMGHDKFLQTHMVYIKLSTLTRNQSWKSF